MKLKDLSILLCLFVALVAMMFYGLRHQNDKPAPTSNESTSVIDSAPSAKDSLVAETLVKAEESKSKSKGFTWHMTLSNDAMTGNLNRQAWLCSDNFIKQEFPYEGNTYMKMVIRDNGQKDVIFIIDRGQVVCNEYDGTNFVRVRFDDKDPMKFRTCESSTGETEYLFLDGKVDKFIRECCYARRIKVEIPIYRYGKAIFDFWVTDPLEW